MIRNVGPLPTFGFQTFSTAYRPPGPSDACSPLMTVDDGDALQCAPATLGDKDKQKTVSPLGKDSTNIVGWVVKFLVHPSPERQTPYIRDDRKWEEKTGWSETFSAHGNGTTGHRTYRAPVEELLSIQKHVAVHSETYFVIKLIAVSGKSRKVTGFCGLHGNELLYFMEHFHPYL